MSASTSAPASTPSGPGYGPSEAGPSEAGPSESTPSESGSSAGHVRPKGGPLHRRLRLRMRSLLFIAFFIVTALPLLEVALWDEHASFRNEIASVRERHLLVARNLS